MTNTNFAKNFLEESKNILKKLDIKKINAFTEFLIELKYNYGRLFVIGVGGSAANASHVVSVFRKQLNIESYTPTDNIAELTARTNDDGWNSVFSGWLYNSKINEKDVVLILSVGGGNIENNTSLNLIEAIDFAKKRGSKILSIVGKEDGYAAKQSDLCVIVPAIDNISAHVLYMQLLITNLLSSNPKLKEKQ